MVAVTSRRRSRRRPKRSKNSWPFSDRAARYGRVTLSGAPIITIYLYIWEYTVHPGHIAEYERAYRPDGTWGKLFRRADGYIRTELHRDRGNPLRYITIDYWTSFESWEAFRSEFAAEFEQLDAVCEGYTEAEREIGRFVPVE